MYISTDRHTKIDYFKKFENIRVNFSPMFAELDKPFDGVFCLVSGFWQANLCNIQIKNFWSILWYLLMMCFVITWQFWLDFENWINLKFQGCCSISSFFYFILLQNEKSQQTALNASDFWLQNCWLQDSSYFWWYLLIKWNVCCDRHWCKSVSPSKINVLL